MNFTFNWFYVDTRDIACSPPARLPIRAKGVDPDLPRWGDGKWDWTGFLPTAQHPQVDRPAVGLPGQLEQQAGSRHLLGRRHVGLGPGPAGARATRPGQASSPRPQADPRPMLTADMIDAATVDVRGAYVLPDMLAVVGDDPALKQYTDLLQTWVASGAHRVDRARTGHYTDQAAIALDGHLVSAGGQGGSGASARRSRAAFRPARQPPQPAPRLVLGQRRVLSVGHPGPRVSSSATTSMAPMSQQYCGKGDLATCRDEIRQTLTAAVATLASRQKTRTPRSGPTTSPTGRHPVPCTSARPWRRSTGRTARRSSRSSADLALLAAVSHCQALSAGRLG